MRIVDSLLAAGMKKLGNGSWAKARKVCGIRENYRQYARREKMWQMPGFHQRGHGFYQRRKFRSESLADFALPTDAGFQAKMSFQGREACAPHRVTPRN
jgi:hypothetical protein